MNTGVSCAKSQVIRTATEVVTERLNPRFDKPVRMESMTSRLVGHLVGQFGGTTASYEKYLSGNVASVMVNKQAGVTQW